VVPEVVVVDGVGSQPPFGAWLTAAPGFVKPTDAYGVGLELLFDQVLVGVIEAGLGHRRQIAHAVNEKQIGVNGERKWLYAAIDTDSRLLLEIDVFSRAATDSASAFLHRFTKKHDVSNTKFFVDAGRYLTALARRKLRSQLNYSERNLIGKSSQLNGVISQYYLWV
jgi:hypothetical protein